MPFFRFVLLNEDAHSIADTNCKEMPPQAQ